MTYDQSRRAPRIYGVDPENLGEREQQIFENQVRKWGQPLANHLIYARIPEIFHGARGMWGGLANARTLERTLLLPC